MRRGDLLAVAFSGDYGKPRPALVVQSDLYHDLDSITVLPLTSEVLALANTRFMIEPTPQNGLRTVSYVMIDKVGTLRRDKVGPLIGQISEEQLAAVTRALALFLGIA